MRALAPRTPLARARGFTLVELMIVVAIIGVLSALAIVGYRKYIESAKTGEPMAVIQSIRTAEEEFKDKTMAYLNVSQSSTYYPRASGFNSKKAAWINPNHADVTRWQTLGVTVSGPVRFGYKVNTAGAGQALNGVTIDFKPTPTLTPSTNPWYLIQAYGDTNENGKFTALIATSYNTNILVNEDQLPPPG